MNGTKASFLAQWAQENGVNFLRFDYSGCGQSQGDFYQRGISHWSAEASAVFSAHAKGKQLVIASSMGAWCAIHLLKRFSNQIGAVIFIAPAPDFTHKLLSPKFRQKILDEGDLAPDHPSGPLSRFLIEDAANQLVMDRPDGFS